MAAGSATEAPTRAGSRKRDVVSDLTDKFGRATSAVITDFRGLTVAQLQQVRATLRAKGIDYIVVKNTLARRAATDAGIQHLSSVLTGPVGLAIGYDDLSAPAKVLNEYFRANRRLPAVAGYVEGTVLDADGVKMLADLPTREVLLSQLAGTLESPLTQLASALSSITSQLASALEAYREKLATAG